MSILQNIGGDVDSNHPQNTRNGCSPLNNQAGADSSLPNVNGAANTGLKQGKLLLAKELKEVISSVKLEGAK
jgi:hypothetical protein